MDHRMPLKNGLDATKEIMDFDPQAKIFFISADNSIREKALNSGAVVFLGKPVRSANLLKQISQFLNMRDIERSIKTISPTHQG